MNGFDSREDSSVPSDIATTLYLTLGDKDDNIGILLEELAVSKKPMIFILGWKGDSYRTDQDHTKLLKVESTGYRRYPLGKKNSYDIDFIRRMLMENKGRIQQNRLEFYIFPDTDNEGRYSIFSRHDIPSLSKYFSGELLRIIRNEN